jgi:hypothetical protein
MTCFGFPKDAKLSFKWSVAIKKIDEKGKVWAPKSRHDRVCMAHFLSTDFKDNIKGMYTYICA